MTKEKMKSFVRDAKESNKNLKGDEHKTLDKYGTVRTVLLLRGKVCNIPSVHDHKGQSVSEKHYKY